VDPASDRAPDEVLTPLLAQIDVFQGRMLQVVELGGGLTNHNYRVRTDDGGDYVVRVSDNESGGLLAIDRARERVNTERAWQAGVGAPVIQALPEVDVLVVGFLQGRTLEAADLRDPAVIPRVAAAVRTLHAGPAFEGSFDMRQLRRRYLRIVRERGFRLPDDYLALEPLVERLEDAMRPGDEPLVPCNNDLLAANFIDDGKRIWLIDYEYSGMNEASFELGNIASESGLDDGQTEALVTAYWGRRSAVKLARAQAWSLLARYGWTLWASIQDGASTIDFDFWGWGMEKYDSARAELIGPRLDALLDALTGGLEGEG
jgi:thiamine kinase-like enzyme